MRNKNGFTLIEISISVTLLSVVMVFMFKFLDIIRKDEVGMSDKTDMLINKTLISKTINEDIRASLGINNIECIDNSCTLVLNNDESKVIELSKDKRTLTYKNITTDEVILRRKTSDGYIYNLSLKQNDSLKLIEIGIDSHEEYNVEIVYYNSDEDD